MPRPVPIPLLPLPARHADTLALSARDCRNLAARLRKKKYRGVAIVGWPKNVAATVGALRNGGIVVGIMAPENELIERIDALSGAGPMLAIVDGPAAQFAERLGSVRSATLRATCRSAGSTSWQPDVRVDVGGDHRDADSDAISNQFDLAEVDDAAPDGATITVVDGDAVRHFAIDRGGFGDAEIDGAIDLGQLYLDISSAARLHDFAAETRQLRRSGDGTWRVVDGDPFAAEEADLLAILGDLRGLVVDVGAGPVRYVRSLNAAIDAGTLRYFAIEPDPDHLSSAAAAMPAGTFVRGVGESLPLANACADAVSMLRSWNHLVDPDAAVAEAARVVRPGGLLVAVDNVLFGLCRSREQLARARAIPVSETPFEHLRNANADEAATVVERSAAWSLERVEPVTAGTANQWLLVARRNPD